MGSVSTALWSAWVPVSRWRRRSRSPGRARSSARSALHGVEVPIETVIFRNVGLRGGVAPVRRYIPELLDDVLEGRIHPGRVFDFETDLDHVADAYAAMASAARSSRWCE